MTRHSTGFGAFNIEHMPSQPQLALCHGFFVKHDQRGKGMGHALKEAQKEQLREHGYDYGICTVDSANEVQQKVLAASGWNKIAEFRNTKTGGYTYIYGWAP